MKSIEELVEESRDPRLDRQPAYVQNLIHALANRMQLEVRAAEGVRRNAQKEVDELRAQLTKGPEDSDTFMDLPYSRVGDVEGQRPLGKGVSIEFRPSADMIEGEGFDVKLTEDGLKISGVNRLAVLPQYPNEIIVKAD